MKNTLLNLNVVAAITLLSASMSSLASDDCQITNANFLASLHANTQSNFNTGRMNIKSEYKIDLKNQNSNTAKTTVELTKAGFVKDEVLLGNSDFNATSSTSCLVTKKEFAELTATAQQQISKESVKPNSKYTQTLTYTIAGYCLSDGSRCASVNSVSTKIITDDSTAGVSAPQDLIVTLGAKPDNVSPSKRLFVFTDPACPYCKKLDPMLESLSKKGWSVTVFPSSVSAASDVKIASLSCIKDEHARAAQWLKYTNGEPAIAASCDSSKTAAKRSQKFMDSVGVTGLPAMMNSYGTLKMGGFGSEDEIKAWADERGVEDDTND